MKLNSELRTMNHDGQKSTKWAVAVQSKDYEFMPMFMKNLQGQQNPTNTNQWLPGARGEGRGRTWRGLREMWGVGTLLQSILLLVTRFVKTHRTAHQRHYI